MCLTFHRTQQVVSVWGESAKLVFLSFSKKPLFFSARNTWCPAQFGWPAHQYMWRPVHHMHVLRNLRHKCYNDLSQVCLCITKPSVYISALPLKLKRKINEHASQISILFRSSYHLKDVEALGGVPEEARVEEVEEAHSPWVVIKGSPWGRACRVVMGKESALLHPYWPVEQKFKICWYDRQKPQYQQKLKPNEAGPSTSYPPLFQVPREQPNARELHTSF